jgi:class 3 adenylate cyclase
VLNNAVNATVLFLDLRGFTKTSEGQISERDLTRELYTVFDAFVPHVLRFGGTVDKFLGDGMMVHYGTASPTAGPLQRAAHRDPVPGDDPAAAPRGPQTATRWACRSTTAGSTWRASSRTSARPRHRSSAAT